MRSITKGAFALAIGLACGAFSGSAIAQSSSNYAMISSCISSGAAQMSSSGYAMTATVGQPFVGVSEGNTYKIWCGFITPDDSIVATPYDRVDQLKSLADGTAVQVAGKIATTDASDFTGFIYIEEPNRSCGIRVEYTSISGTLTKGCVVTVEGTISTSASGERVIKDAVVTAGSSSDLLSPVGMTNKSLGGGNYGDPDASAGQYGVSGGSGTNNIGLLARVWGQVTPIDNDYVSIDDGSGVNVKVYTGGLSSQPSGYAVVTGISSLYGSKGNAERLILAVD